jgi:phosphoribosylformylglycinamidine synthase
MPHPERMIDKYLSGSDGSIFFETLLNNLKWWSLMKKLL